MHKIKLVIFLWVIVYCNTAFSQGYVDEYKSVSAAFGVSNYHAKVLDNRGNNGQFLSYSGNVGYHIPISGMFNFNQQLGFGLLQSADTSEPFWTHSNQFSYAFGVSMNLPKFFSRGYSKKLVPYAAINYQINYYKNTSVSRPNQLLTQFNVGGGVSYQLNDFVSVYTQLLLGQRLGADFKTSLNTQLGLQALIF